MAKPDSEDREHMTIAVSLGNQEGIDYWRGLGPEYAAEIEELTEWVNDLKSKGMSPQVAHNFAS